jgi:pimeloyl-ACP methyl ester carboxylesterase
VIHIRKLLFAALLLVGALSPEARAGKAGRFLEVGGREVFVSYRAPAPGQPTLVLLNGLTYSLGNWDAYVAALGKRAKGLGVLRFDLIGMGDTLLRGALPVNYAIPYSDQVELTAAVMSRLGVRKAFVAGLSYGGGIAVAFAAAHPERVEQLILMAPFTEPLKAMDSYIQGEVTANRLAFPLNPASDDELYDFFLRQFIYQAYPALEPSVLENPFKLEGIFRMVQGIRKYDTLKDARALPPGSTHLLVADQDQYIQKEVHDRFWRAVPPAARASRIDISVTEHKIPEAIPAFAAAWTAEILRRRPELNQGRSFEGHAQEMTARSGSVSIPLR